MLEAQIQQAMRGRRVVGFYYDGYYREVEPHVLGLTNGVHQFLGYQIGGQSRSGTIPDWRRFDLNRIGSLQEANRLFGGPRPTATSRHSRWDHVIEIVS